jgi:hypothetical protein
MLARNIATREVGPEWDTARVDEIRLGVPAVRLKVLITEHGHERLSSKQNLSRRKQAGRHERFAC